VALQKAKEVEGVVIYTLVSSELKRFLEQKANEIELMHVDIIGPIMNAITTVSALQPKCQHGLIHKTDEAYFKKIEAIEFAVKFDDGKEPRDLLKADLVLIGISRTSKTPLCMYLAYKGIKAANVPLIPNVTLPEELFNVATNKIIGLMIKPSLLLEIRKERLKTMGLSIMDDYANLEHIYGELDYAVRIMKKVGCPIIDVSNKAIEETASKLLEFHRKGARP
jgi:regulator of PEP synthase PpsR (kinase-PPPase family)